MTYYRGSMYIVCYGTLPGSEENYDYVLSRIIRTIEILIIETRLNFWRVLSSS